MSVLVFIIGYVLLIVVGIKISKYQKQERQEAEKQRKYEAKRHYEELLANNPEYRRQYEESIAEARREEENERRRKEEARRKALSGKFKYTTIAGFKAAYRFDYYPVNRYPYGSIPSADDNARKNIWKFKDGAYSIGANIAADFIDGNFTREEMENIALCVIPASSRDKNEVRYRSMCEQVAERLPIINGFRYISLTADREDTRTSGKNSDTTAYLAFSSDIQGKDIVLFDDVTTRGTSFAQAAMELKRRGARSVYGLFIGKTV